MSIVDGPPSGGRISLYFNLGKDYLFGGADLGNILRKHASDITRTMDITSGAAHDALVMARHYPSAMLFVPCEGGRSHCPEEKADPGDFALAAEVLYRSFLEMG